MSRRWVVALVVAGLTLFAGGGWGEVQEPLLSWKVIVIDPQGGPLLDADVDVTPEGSETSIQKKTGAQGEALFSVVAGTYRVRANHAGFRGAEGLFDVSAGGPASATLQLGPPDSVEVKPYWNSWAMGLGGQQPTASLLPNEDYTVYFDLSGINYQQILDNPNLTARLSPKVKQELDRLGGDKGLVIEVARFIQGASLTLRNEDPRPERKSVQIDKLLETEKNLQPREEIANITELSGAVRGLQVAVRIHTEDPGPGIVGLAIWDAETRQPLDFVALEVRVVSSAAQAVPSPPAIQVTSGWRSLRGSPSAPTAAASLAVFEHGNAGDLSFSNTVFFLDSFDWVRWWNPRRSIRDYVSLEGQFGLIRQLELAQCNGDFEQIGNLFSGVLFSAPDRRGLKAAQDSQKELDVLISRSLGQDWEHRPVIATLFYNIDTGALPMPLGLLGVHDRLPGRVPHAHRLGEVAVVTQPLPQPRRVEKYDPSDPYAPCIRFITTVLPKTLGLGDHCECEALDRLLKPVVPPDPRYLITKFSGLKEYLEEPDPTGEREGLLLIAHHADGFMSLDPSFYPALQAENVTRQYEPGSAAILVGCTVGALTPLNRSLPFLETLNERGVDAMIFSPFTVDAALGSRLAVHFSAEIEKLRNPKNPPPPPPITLRDLYYRTLDAMQDDKDAQPFLAELSELSLAGSSDVLLCPDPPPASYRVLAEPVEKPRQCRCTIFDRMAQGLQALGGPPDTSSSNGPVKTGVGPGERAAAKRCRETKP